MINYMHINCKELSYMYGHILNYFHELKENGYIFLDRFIDDIKSNIDNDSYVEIAYDNKRLIGFICYHLNEHYKNVRKENRCEIALFVVDPLYRNNGIGTHLLNEAINNMIDKGLSECYLECSKEIDNVGYNYWINRDSKIMSVQNEGNYNITLFKIDELDSKINKLVLRKY